METYEEIMKLKEEKKALEKKIKELTESRIYIIMGNVRVEPRGMHYGICIKEFDRYRPKWKSITLAKNMDEIIEILKKLIENAQAVKEMCEERRKKNADAD